MLTIANHGPLILSSDYWGSEYDRAGVLYLSINAGAFRLLLPAGWEREVDEMRSAKLAVVSRGPWPTQRRSDAIEILFDDGSDNPYAIHMDIRQCDRLPLDSEQAAQWVLSVWTAPRRGKPHKALERPAQYRRVDKLPCLEPWTNCE